MPTTKKTAAKKTPAKPAAQEAPHRNVAPAPRTKKAAPASKSIMQKMVEIVGKIGPQEQLGWNDFHKYHYYTEGQLMDALRGHLCDFGLLLLTSIAGIERGVFRNAKDKEERIITVYIDFTIYDTDSNEKITLKGVGEGADVGDKALYKAETGALKYLLQKNFMVASPQNLDPESDEEHDKRNAQQPPHSPHKGNEDTAAGRTTVGTTAAAELRAFLAEHSISEEFALQCAVIGKLAEAETTFEEMKPGNLARLLQNSAGILKRFREANEGTGKGAALAGAVKKAPKPHGGQTIRVMANGDEPFEFLKSCEVTDWMLAICPDGRMLGKHSKDEIFELIATYAPEKARGKFKREALILDASLCVAQATQAEWAVD